jgi:cell filamentation protein
MSSDLLAALEADFTFNRIVELELDPVRGNFDAAHLCEINRRIFQDLPANGFVTVTPGKFRNEVKPGSSWLKQRKLETLAGTFFVAYSRMDDKAHDRMDDTLSAAKPKLLRQGDINSITKTVANLYAELDYIHPFPDGNSRTLRTFTRQLACEAGYELDWSIFNVTPGARDGLYIARDLAVNRLALPEIENESTMRKITASLAALRAYPDIHVLIGKASKANDLPAT